MKSTGIKMIGMGMLIFLVMTGIIYGQQRFFQPADREVVIDNSQLVCNHAKEVRLTATTTCEADLGVADQDDQFEEFLNRIDSDPEFRGALINRFDTDESFRQQILDLVDIDALLGLEFEENVKNDAEFRKMVLQEFNNDPQFRKDTLELIRLLRENSQ